MPRKHKHRLQCQCCGGPFWTLDRTQETCSRSCKGRLQHARKPSRMTEMSQAAKERRLPPETPRPTFATVEQAKAARLARERATGQRTYTIENPWAQRGAGHYSNPGADTMGHGFK
jgi:hypothetical protein